MYVGMYVCMHVCMYAFIALQKKYFLFLFTLLTTQAGAVLSKYYVSKIKN